MYDVLSNEIDSMEKAFESIERDVPSLKPVVNAFREIMISRVILKATLSDRSEIHVLPPEPSRFTEGHPLLTEETIASLIGPWGKSVESTMQSLARAFPNIAAEVLRLSDALKAGNVDLKQCIGFLVERREEDIDKIAAHVGSQPTALKFILGQMLKPFVEKRTESLRPLIENLPWQKGYCPICGAFPEMRFVKGEEGQRWLRCSLCGYEWEFDRQACPYCGEKNETKDFISVAGFEHQWVELCHHCHRYIVGIDLRKQIGVTAVVASVGMVHLDIIAQNRGFLPAAECAWSFLCVP